MPAEPARILVAEDEPSLREALRRLLAARGYEVTASADGVEAIAALGRSRYDLVIADLCMPGLDGMAVLRQARQIAPQTLVVLATAHASVDTAVAALREGVVDYIRKPLPFADFVRRVVRILELRSELSEARALRRHLNAPADLGPFFVGRSAAVEEIRRLIAQLAPIDSTVLLTGESGVGKDVAARAMHHLSPRHHRRFLPVNCAAIPPALLESELFGHARGAFTGAHAATEGLFRRAEGGTIFLDEIGDLPPPLQVKLLRAIELKEILPIGTTAPIRVDVRILASTNRDLRREVDRGGFREDLYYRLKGIRVDIPPLRERPEDVPPLVEHLLRRQNLRLRRAYKGVSNAAMALLREQPWRGNVRELDHVIEYAAIVGDGEWIELPDLPAEIRPAPPAAVGGTDDLGEALRSFEKAHIENVLRRCGEDRRVTAARLGVHLATLYRKIHELRIRPVA